MNKIPYDLYILLDQLNPLFNESQTQQENVIKCAFASLELSTNLLGTISQQAERPLLLKTITHILNGIETQFHLLNTYKWNLPVHPFKKCYSQHLEKLKLLGDEYRKNIDRITSLYFQLSQKFTIGLEDQMNDIRRHFSLPQVELKTNSATSNKTVLSNVITTLNLDELNYFNSEDKLFMVTHQISECWFNIIIKELRTIETCLPKMDVDQILDHFDSAYDILIYLAEHILLLEHMILSDYHPLRVALRGASGGQSQQAHEMFYTAKKTYSSFLNHLECEGKQLIYILEEPKQHADLLLVINSFTKLERSLKNFFFQHYILSSGVIGSQSFGSIGYDLVSLVDKFVEPIFIEIDQAKYDLTLKTNFQYGDSAGILIFDKEENVPEIKGNRSSSAEHMRQAIHSYFEAISELNMDKWVNLFTENGYIEDPVGSRPYVGHKQLAIFFKGVVRFFAELNMTIETTVNENSSTRVSWRANAKTYNGKAILFKGEEVFRLDEKGKILSAQVFWSPSVISDQL